MSPQRRAYVDALKAHERAFGVWQQAVWALAEAKKNAPDALLTDETLAFDELEAEGEPDWRGNRKQQEIGNAP